MSSFFIIFDVLFFVTGLFIKKIQIHKFIYRFIVTSSHIQSFVGGLFKCFLVSEIEFGNILSLEDSSVFQLALRHDAKQCDTALLKLCLILRDGFLPLFHGGNVF